MRTDTLLVFDQFISGTSTTWYSVEDFYKEVGAAESFAVQACTTSVEGFLPALTVASEHSSDGQNWAVTNNTEINGTLIAEGGSYAGTSGLFLVPARFIRFKISLTGTGPGCRLKLYVTARGSASEARSEERSEQA